MYTNDTERLFAEGGMNDEGGTVDPVSGNDVPPGSLKSEVRDDIDAKLSEGEFVIPADVVRYIGLERLMKLRDEAKQGLARMAEIGQMGNADQVENPESLHEGDDGFESEIDDIMKEVEGGETEENNFAAGGGVVRVPPADKDILAKYNIQRTSITNPALDVRLLKNAAGDSLYMTYFNGMPGSAIPEGYSVVDANPASRMTGTGFTDTTKTTNTGSTVKQNVTGAASVDAGNQNLTTTTNNTSMTDLALGNVAITGKDGKVTTTTDGGTTTTDGGLGVNSYGGAITSDATGAVSTGVGGFTLNPDGTVTANKVNQGLTAAAGIVNPILGIAARINNALATSSAADFTRSIADTMGTNIDTSTAAATAGPTGTGGSAASAAADAAAAATSMGMSGAAAGAASQAAADVITRGGNAADAAEAGRAAAAEVARGEQSSTEILGQEEKESAYRESLGGFDVAGPMDFGGSTGGGGKYFDDQSMATMAMAKGGLVSKRMKNPTPARKKGIASKR